MEKIEQLKGNCKEAQKKIQQYIPVQCTVFSVIVAIAAVVLCSLVVTVQFWKPVERNKETKQFVESKLEALTTQLLEKKFGNLTLEQLTELKGTIKEIKSEVEQIKSEVKQIKLEVKRIKSEVIPRDNLVWVLMLLLVIEVGRMIVWVLRSAETFGYFAPKPKTELKGEEVLDRIKQNENLKSMICLISFDEDHTEDYLTLLRGKIKEDIKVHTHVIRKHQDILALPQCQMYVMFAEFTERHVIIEQPGLGLGDLKRTTYSAVQTIKGGLVIVYYRDPGSRSLPPDTIYNKGIYCVGTQPELQNLSRQGRFLSVYNSFTDVQSEALRRAVKDNLNIRV